MSTRAHQSQGLLWKDYPVSGNLGKRMMHKETMLGSDHMCVGGFATFDVEKKKQKKNNNDGTQQTPI